MKFEVLFAFVNANLYNDGVIVFTHCVDPDVSRVIYNWAHTKDFYIAKDWFGMNDFDLQFLMNPSELLNSCSPHPFFYTLIFCMPVFLTFPCTFHVDSQVLHQGPF